ncbi:hypothetical protein J2Y45_006843 [Dyadobacter sp. BE34]|uniref:Calcineurin-like phosphoesterase domain-containing protein n=1 Tax=Dyadobacter fermentans TaxID=94254 RepID=A0ABU1R8Q0_9BACT|nr:MULTISPECIES: metallophosphoesterase [Dyadobacter]MDR6809776.1 hypothetical protein [Dyadobacter fermentans]MDR7047509.1 hypothetical protein [Dyadobacter sp. BE242]MDR7201679.1 hypothetical protein [Dyadobacter sp. BE34]MDR7219549.1 hypothetical protein [Dyadobacter sp. BE31]MDR7267328.1 hypothetical protein [Dyadobacter sp. BE32]
MGEPILNLMNRRQTIKLLSAGAFSSLTLACRSETKTVPLENLIRFAVASDGHYGETGTPWRQNFEDLITALTKEHKASPLHFTVINGDIVHRTATNLLDEAKAYLDKLPCPYFVTRGNHDRVSDQVWESVWGYPPNQIISRKNFTLLLVDTSNQAGDTLCGNPIWIEKMMQSVGKSDPTFLFMHIPYFRVNTTQECPEIPKVISRYSNIRAIFHGHDHSKDTGIMVGQQAILFDGHFGSSWGTPYRGYRIVQQVSDSSFSTYQYNFSNQTRINDLTF